MDGLTHEELMEITRSALYTMTVCDTLLRDLPTDITLDEVLAQIAVEHGQSIRITVLRDTETPLSVIVPQKSTVLDVKKSIKRHFEMYQRRIKDPTKISWNYIWRTYNLELHGIVLENDRATISSYGVGNKSVLKFKRKSRQKGEIEHQTH